MEVLWLSTDTNNHVYFSKDIAARYLIKKKMTIRFGQFSHEVSVEINEELPQNTIAISEFIFKQYNIPTKLTYEIVISDDTIKIGPVIGIMISFKRFFRGEHIGRTLDYHHIKGLLFICEPEDVNLEEGTIKGYYFNPNGKTKVTQWIEEIFPFPDVIYNRRTRLTAKLYNEFVQHNVLVFNSHYLNKWQQFEIFSEKPELASFLPETMKLTKSALIKMLKNYDEIYVKPTSKANGTGISLIKKRENGFDLIDTNSRIEFFHTIDSLYKVIKRKNYLLQQSVAYKAENRNVDFRVMLQKDETKKWCYNGFICKVSHEDSIITNDKCRQKLVRGLKALKSLYNVTTERAKEIEKEMAQLCERLANSIEEKGIHLGDVAFDIIVDSNLKLWVLEIQIRYGATVYGENASRSKFYRKSMVTPLYYAKALAGF
ncbi:YheC/YheD family protein [Sporosarcina ureilytica]|uniref:ATP-grasp domain-containing protein n=1 Tax=Sporosarcina ureilytica TaxID=298596 RepID=A0A1D8JGX6_9BACL|nr:YheC/YheD family protein [Sporosarcina ureilytica]AOV07951.1 hypothetical protein BI350_10655 [Sporosarcina ureilytica]